MKTHTITLQLQVRSNSSERDVRELLEVSLCDAKYAHSRDVHTKRGWEVKSTEGHVVAVDAGHSPCMLSAEPYMHGGVAYEQIVPWKREVTA